MSCWRIGRWQAVGSNSDWESEAYVSGEVQHVPLARAAMVSGYASPGSLLPDRSCCRWTGQGPTHQAGEPLQMAKPDTLQASIKQERTRLKKARDKAARKKAEIDG